VEKLLPRLQLISVAVFAVISVVGPLLFAQAIWVILAAVLAGLTLGVATLLIGWRWYKGKSQVIYPFGGWSAGILKPFLGPRQALALSPGGLVLTPTARRVFGIASLAIGALLIVGLLMVAFYVLME
jgi:hypothetical protein